MPVLNRPFLSYQLDIFKEAGVTRRGAGRRQTFEAVARRAEPVDVRRGMRMHFAFEPEPLGTGGAIRFAYGALKKKIKTISGPVLVFNGDVFFNLPVREFVSFHRDNSGSRHRGADARRRSVALRRCGARRSRRRPGVLLRNPTGPVSTNLINAGAYLLNSEWIEKIPTGRPVSIEKESFPQSLERGDPMFGFKMSGYWNDIGTHASYLQAHHRPAVFDKQLDTNFFIP